jgi:hypothetical protein
MMKSFMFLQLGCRDKALPCLYDFIQYSSLAVNVSLLLISTLAH